MYYTINVSKNGIHYFATESHSIRTKEKLIIVYKDFQEKFKEEDGYQILVHQDLEQQWGVDMDKILNK